MDEFVLFGAIIIGAALAFFGVSCLLEYRKSKRQQEEYERQAELDRQEREYQAQRDKFRRDRQSFSKSASYASHAPNARATVLKMRKDEQSASSSDAIADAMILQTMFMAQPHHVSEPEAISAQSEPMQGHGGTFDGGGASGDWSSASSDSGSSSSSDSSSSDSGSSSGGGD